MQSLRERKNLFYMLVVFSVVFLAPVFFLYIDRTIIDWIRYFHKYHIQTHRILNDIDIFVNFISNGLTQLTIAFMLFVFGRFLNKRLQDAGKSLIVGFLLSGITVQILKHSAGRARPRLSDRTVFIGPSLKDGYDSFPSGHITVTFCLAYILSQYFPRYRIAFYGVAVITAFERVEDISHFPSDVLAGAIIGIVIAKLLSAKIIRPREPAICRE